jgi:hypothetical protein
MIASSEIGKIGRAIHTIERQRDKVCEPRGA